VLSCGFNNEIGYDEEIMFVKNLTGFWIWQEYIRQLTEKNAKIDYVYLQNYALKNPFDGYFNCEDPVFMESGGMAAKIRDNCIGKKPESPE